MLRILFDEIWEFIYIGPVHTTREYKDFGVVSTVWAVEEHSVIFDKMHGLEIIL